MRNPICKPKKTGNVEAAKVVVEYAQQIPSTQRSIFRVNTLDINAEDRHGMTPLHAAVMSGVGHKMVCTRHVVSIYSTLSFFQLKCVKRWHIYWTLAAKPREPTNRYRSYNLLQRPYPMR